MLGVNPPLLPRSSRALKRAMDVAYASVLLLVLVPVILAVAVAIGLDTPSPILFAGERGDSGDRRFWLFRSLRLAATWLESTSRVSSSNAPGRRASLRVTSARKPIQTSFRSRRGVVTR